MGRVFRPEGMIYDADLRRYVPGSLRPADDELTEREILSVSPIRHPRSSREIYRSDNLTECLRIDPIAEENRRTEVVGKYFRQHKV